MIPGPRGWAALRTVRDLRSDPLGALIRLQRHYGDILSFRYGPIHRVITFDARAVQRILQDNHLNYNKDSPFYHMLGWFLGQGLITSDGELHQRQRRLIQPSFQRARIDELQPMMVRTTERVLEGLRPGQVLDLSAFMIDLTLRIIGQALFGEDLSARDDGIGTAVEELQRQMQRRFRSPFPLKPIWPFAEDRRFRRVILQLRTLIAHKTSRMLPPMPEEQLVDELITLMLAGHETVANTLTWAVALLSRHPAPKENDPHRVVLETLRLFPPVGVFGRRSIGSDELCGHPIGPRQIVSTSPWVLHRHPDYWDNPEGFDPDRFLQEPVRGAFVPFAAGPRQCLGNYFALLEATTVLSTLRQHVRLDLIPGQPLVIDPQITLRPRGPLWVRVGTKGW